VKPLHHQQLFHWFGRDIGHRTEGAVADREETALKYLRYLKSSLRFGLWCKPPEKPERHICELGLEPLPITCFTEWRVEQSARHISKYGLLGLGFPRRWVAERGGQPVTYFDGSKKSNYFDSVRRVWRSLEGTDAAADFFHLAHFSREARSPREPAGGTTRKKNATRRVRPPRQDPCKRKLTGPMQLVEEREWRIVYPSNPSPSLAKHFRPVQGRKPRPTYFIPYEPGSELFTVVLPDNLTMSLVLADKELRELLFQPNRPPVALISLEDVGTF